MIRRYLRPAGACLVLLGLAACPGCVGTRATRGSTPAEADRVLLGAARCVRAAVVAALEDGGEAAEAALAACDRQAQRVAAALSPAARPRYERAAAALRAARGKGRPDATARSALQLYRVLAAAVDAGPFAPPPGLTMFDLAMLDAGVGLRAEPPDWPRVEAAAGTAARAWTVLSGHTPDPAFLAEADVAVRALREAARERDAEIARLAARLGSGFAGPRAPPARPGPP